LVFPTGSVSPSDIVGVLKTVNCFILPHGVRPPVDLTQRPAPEILVLELYGDWA
jgi:hypothetical protein